LVVVEQGTDARGKGLQRLVTGSVTKEIVDLLEPVEIEAEDTETLARYEARDFLVDARVEKTSVRQSRQRVVMREEMDMLLGILASLEIAHGNHVVRTLGEDDGPHDQFD